MPHFTSTPPEKPSGPGLRLIRTPSPGKLTAIVTCPSLVGCPTHFYQKRTIPCEPPDCPACAVNLPWRWHGYLSAVDVKSHEHFLFEMTAQAAEPFTLYRDRHHTLIGCLFEASRLGDHHNSRVIIRCKPADLTQTNLPHSPDLVGCLCHLWNVTKPEVRIDGLMKDNPRIRLERSPEGNNEPVKQPQTQT